MQHGQLITQQHGPLHPEVPSPPLGGEGGGRSDRNIQVSNPHTCNKTKRFCSPGQRCVYLMRLILIPTLRVLGSPSVSFLICINYGAGSTEQMNWCYFHWRARFIKIKFKSIQKTQFNWWKFCPSSEFLPSCVWFPALLRPLKGPTTAEVGKFQWIRRSAIAVCILIPFNIRGPG